jgi:hypothetical protein
VRVEGLVTMHITKTSTGKIVTENNQKHIPNVAWFSIFLGKQYESLYRKKSVITGKNVWTFPESYPTGKIVTENNQKHIPNVAWFSIFLQKQYESLYRKKSVITRKKFWTYPEYFRTVPKIFPLFPVTTVLSGKTLQTFSGIQFLS